VSESVVVQVATKERSAAAPVVGCVLAWLLPGLGHLYLGKKGRAAVFFLVVAVMFGLGIMSDGAESLVEEHQPLTVLATFDNVALGPIDLLGRYLTYGTVVYALPGDEGDSHRTELLDRQRAHVRSVTYEYGNTFLLTAGLMNLLLILDAFDIATGRKD
jgi:TM2 domain-containing membrane protein YozV